SGYGRGAVLLIRQRAGLVQRPDRLQVVIVLRLLRKRVPALDLRLCVPGDRAADRVRGHTDRLVGKEADNLATGHGNGADDIAPEVHPSLPPRVPGRGLLDVPAPDVVREKALDLSSAGEGLAHRSFEVRRRGVGRGLGED